MTLSTGATLQNGKYLVQVILSRSDFGLTYRARHTYLDQTVVLQSLNEVAQERSDFGQLRQQFASGARQLAKYPVDHPLRALDYFEEEGFPFVVLQFVAEQIPKLSDWFTLPVEPSATPLEETLAPQTEAIITQSPARLELSSMNEAASTTVPQSTVATEPLFVSIPPIDPQLHKASINKKQVAPLQSYKKRRLPKTLLITGLVGAAIGAGMGLAVRLQSKAQLGQASSQLGNGLFTREQSFPSGGDWPISETPATTPPEQIYKNPATSLDPAFNTRPAEVEPFLIQQPVRQAVPPAPLNPVPVDLDNKAIAPLKPQREVQDSPVNPSIERPRESAATSTIETPPPRVQPRAIPVAPVPVAPAPAIEAPPPAPAAPPESTIRKPRVVDQ